MQSPAPALDGITIYTIFEVIPNAVSAPIIADRSDPMH